MSGTIVLAHCDSELTVGVDARVSSAAGVLWAPSETTATRPACGRLRRSGASAARKHLSNPARRRRAEIDRGDSRAALNTRRWAPRPRLRVPLTTRRDLSAVVR